MRLAAAAVVLVAAAAALSACGSSGPAWCKSAAQMEVTSGEPDQVSIDIITARLAGIDLQNASDLEAGQVAVTGLTAMRSLASQEHKAGCP